MTEWRIAVSQEDGDGTPVFTEVRRLSDHEYERLESAILTLRHILGRTAWSILQSNYESFRLLEAQLVSKEDDSFSPLRLGHDAVQIAVTTAIVNFLFAMRMFLDQSEAELKRLDETDGTDRFSLWKAACSAEYDDWFAYRFLYLFRNYVQHIGLPVATWNISSSLTDSDAIVARTRLGESPVVSEEERGDVVTRIFLAESPRDLLQKYGRWKTVREDLESLTTEIDLSEQIHVCMECLARVALAFQDLFSSELAVAVKDFKAVVGDLGDYASRPMLLKLSQDDPVWTATMMDLEIAKFVQAERLVKAKVS